MKTFDFPLPESIEYSEKGELTSGDSITFYAPKSNQRKESAKLKQMFFRAMPTAVDSGKETSGDSDGEVTGSEVLLLISMSNDVDYVDFIEVGRKIICSDNSKIDDVRTLTSSLLDKIDIQVVEEMIGEYVANFIVSSALKSHMKS